MERLQKTHRNLYVQSFELTAWIINSLPAPEQWPTLLELITSYGVALATNMPTELALTVSATLLIASLLMLQADRHQLRQCCLQAQETFDTCYTTLDHIATISDGLGHPLPTPWILVLAAGLTMIIVSWRNRR